MVSNNFANQILDMKGREMEVRIEEKLKRNNIILGRQQMPRSI
jgi:hypothetical protein